MANPRKRKNDADHGSMKINRFFKPIQKTVVPTPPKNNNDENLPPKGQSVENKRAFGQQSLIKNKPVNAPLRDRNPEVRISASHNTQSNHAPFTILKDDDIKKGVMKVSQFEPKDPIQSSQPSSQSESTHSSQSSCTQKDDFISKIKPRKLFSVYNDSQEENDNEQSHFQQEDNLTNQKPFAVFTDESDSQTTNSQQKKATPKQKPFSIFMDNQDDDQDRQANCSQQQNTVSKQRPFSMFMDHSDDENGSSQASRLQKKSTLKDKPFSVFMDDEDSQPNCLQQKTCPKKKPFSVFMDNLDDGGDKDNQAESSQERNTLKEKPFSVFVDDENNRPDCSQQKTCPKEKPFSIFMDNLDDDGDGENCQTKPSQERNTLKKKPFLVFVDDESNQPDSSQLEKSSPKQEPFSIIVDNLDDDGNSITDSQEEDSTEASFSISMDESSRSNSTPQDDTTERKPFAVLVDNSDDKKHHSDPTLFSQEKPTLKKKLFSVFVDDTLGDSNPQTSDSQSEEAAPKKKFFSIFKDAEETPTKNTKNRLPVYNENKPPVHTVYNDENEPPLEETRVDTNDAFWDDDDDLDTFLTHTRRDDTRPNEEDFFSDDEGSDSYSEIQLLHNDTFSTTFDPLTVEETPAESNNTSRTNSFTEPEALTLEFACPDGPEEVHVAYPNPRGDSLDDKLDLKKD